MTSSLVPVGHGFILGACWVDFVLGACRHGFVLVTCRHDFVPSIYSYARFVCGSEPEVPPNP